jgi:glutamate-1-semialdehyde 2,1-aminomutase
MTNSIESSAAFQQYAKMNPASKVHADRARKVIPSGLSRGLLRHAPFPFYTASGAGAHTTDLDGNQRLDFHGNYTALIHGHAHPQLAAACADQIPLGTAYSAPPAAEVALAELLCERVPGVQKVVFNNSGSEAVMVAIRVARASTGRNRIGLFEGCYHGSTDGVLVGGHGLPPVDDPVRVSRPQAVMAGLANSATEDAVLMRYNDPQAVLEAVAQYGDDLAAIVVEPILGAGGVIPANDTFLRTIREATQRHGIVMICDEVISLRQAVGGAQAYYGVVPDLTTMAKIIGGGFAIGAVGGLNEFMSVLNATEDGGVVANLGTFSANPMSTQAGVVGMNMLDEAAIGELNRLGEKARQGLSDVVERHRAPAQITGTGSLLQIHWTASPVTESRAVETASTDLALLTYLGFSNRGIHTSARGICCLSTPMRDAEIEVFVAAFDDTVQELAQEQRF